MLYITFSVQLLLCHVTHAAGCSSRSVVGSSSSFSYFSVSILVSASLSLTYTGLWTTCSLSSFFSSFCNFTFSSFTSFAKQCFSCFIVDMSLYRELFISFKPFFSILHSFNELHRGVRAFLVWVNALHFSSHGMVRGPNQYTIAILDVVQYINTFASLPVPVSRFCSFYLVLQGKGTQNTLPCSRGSPRSLTESHGTVQYQWLTYENRWSIRIVAAERDKNSAFGNEFQVNKLFIKNMAFEFFENHWALSSQNNTLFK